MVSEIPGLSIPPYVPDYLPVPQVTPFTFRDGMSYIERLENLVKYLNRVLLPEIEEQVNELGTEFADEINNLIEQVNNAVDQIINSTIVVQDPVVATMVNDPNSQTRHAMDALYASISALNAMGVRIDGVETDLAQVKIDYAKTVDVPGLAFNRKKKAVFFGDSWMTISGAILANSIAANLNLDATSYALSNAAFNSGPVTLESQVTTATNDNSVNKGLVEKVIVVAGTNNVFWGRDFTFDLVRQFWYSVKTLYPNAEVYYVPDNANDYNSGRTYQYNILMQAAEYAGVKVAHWSTWLTWYNNGEFYLGTDTNGRQHLTNNGYLQLAGWIASWINGTNLSEYGIDLKFTPIIDDANSTLTFMAGNSMADSFTNRSYLKNGMVYLDFQLNNLTYKSGQTTPSLRLLGTNEPWSPISSSGPGSNVLGNGFAGSGWAVSSNVLPNALGYQIYTQWVGAGTFTQVRFNAQYSLLGALP
jgi:hypothetical protein